jgi:cytochrome c2
MKYIWYGCFLTLLFFSSYLLMKFSFTIKEKTASETKVDSHKAARNYRNNGIDGKALFIEKCASCHHLINNSTGPALRGAVERAPNKKILYEWIRNSQKILESGDNYYKSLYIKYNKTPMNLFPTLSDEEIEAILLYVSPYKQDLEPIATVINSF